MRVKHCTPTLMLSALLLLSTSLMATPAVAEKPEFSKANRLLFLNDHLTRHDYSARYTYLSSQTGSRESDYEGRIIITAHTIPGSDAKRVEFDASPNIGQNQIPVVDQARGNPLIMVFLQSDMLELAKATGGHWRYFQKQMKLALEHDAQVEPVTIEFKGEPLNAERITVRPYAEEQVRRKELGHYRNRTYEFLLSEDLPGEIFELRSVTPAGEESEGIVVEKKVTLQTFEKLSNED